MGSGMKSVLLDTNIIIDYLNGEPKAKDEMDAHDILYISLITYMEVLVGVKNSEKRELVKDYLKTFQIVTIDYAIADMAVDMRQTWKIKLPDAVILACASKMKTELSTRDTKDFEGIPGVRIPYKL